jgi:ligand-binding sensor domain-containing protein
VRISLWKSICILILAALAGSAIYRIYRVYISAGAALADERARSGEKDRLPFEKVLYAPHDKDVVKMIQGAGDVNDLAQFHDSYYAATGGGLIEFSPDGQVLRRFTVLDGLPESDLTALATFAGKLFIGTRTNGIVTFDGESFEGYRFLDWKPNTITALAETEDGLLIGTSTTGLLQFDGKNFTEIKAGKDRIAGVNCIREFGPRLYAGTFANGLYVYENDTWSHFTTAEGMPSNRIVGIEFFNDQLYAATDFGFAVFDNNAFRSLATIPTLAGSAVYDGRIFLTKDDGTVSVFERSVVDLQTSAASEHARLKTLDENLWLFSGAGVSVYRDARFREFSKPGGSITDNFVSAMTFGPGGDLWIGTFRRGVDILTPGGDSRHIESEGLREINYLDINDGQVTAATSAGLFNITGDSAMGSLSIKDGLPSNSTTHFSGDFIETAKGLAIRRGGRLRVLSTVQGLPNNSVYTGIKIGDKYYAGTLGGIAEITDGRIARTFSDSNSNLTTNWVTAFCLAGDRLFIGTYGGGVFELTPSGEIRSFSPDAGKFTVNPNAMFSDGERLFAGTLTGVKTLDLRTQVWKTVDNILPSNTVMSVTGDAGAIYFGTAKGIARVEKAYFAREEKK